MLIDDFSRSTERPGPGPRTGLGRRSQAGVDLPPHRHAYDRGEDYAAGDGEAGRVGY
jgi:hypothetical protein